MSFKDSVSLSILCLDEISIDITAVFKFPTWTCRELKFPTSLLLYYHQFLSLCQWIFALCTEVLWCWVHIYNCSSFSLDWTIHFLIVYNGIKVPQMSGFWQRQWAIYPEFISPLLYFVWRAHLPPQRLKMPDTQPSLLLGNKSPYSGQGTWMEVS